MKHKAHPDFWFHYRHLPSGVQGLADKNFELLKGNPRHPSLQLKKIGGDLYSARVGLDHRALALTWASILSGFGSGRMMSMTG